MTLDKLDYVLAVAEEQNLTRAAERLFISQPTLTVYLNKLEEELGIKLFDRSRSPIQLTSAGSHYLNEMKKISVAEQNLRNELHNMANPKKTISIGIGQVRGQHWLPTLLPIFCGMFPDVNVHVIQSGESHLVDWLKQGTVDVAFGVLAPIPAGLATEDLVYESMMFIAPRSYGLVPEHDMVVNSPENPYILDPNILSGLPFIMPEVTNGMYASAKLIFEKYRIVPSRIITCGNMSTALSLVACGLGVQYTSTSVLQSRDMRNHSDLAFCLLPGLSLNRKVIVSYSPQNDSTGMIQKLIEIIRSEILPYISYIAPMTD